MHEFADILLLLPSLLATARVQDGSDGAADRARATGSFQEVVAPTLANECVRCHGATRPRSAFSVGSREALLRGGRRGAAIVPGDPDASRLLTAIRRGDPDLAMPPKRTLPPTTVAAFETWIRGGAPWPADVELPEPAHESDAAGAPPLSDTWAFEPPRAIAPPTVRDHRFVRDPIDAFIAARLETVRVEPSPPADRRTLIRRATLDVTALPPTPEEVAAFVADPRPDAWERLVDRLLASPRYGERCAADWLDVIRFAETNGFEMNQPRDDAWPFRDWLIAAFNDDRPWSDFVRAELAGDQLGEDAATGFLVAGAWDQVKSPDPELTAIQRDDELHGMAAVTSAAFLGLTVGCAKCHDHKFDPITQHDYYSLRACFEGVEFGSRTWRREASDTSLLPGREPVDARRNIDRFDAVLARRVRFTVEATNGGEPCIDELEILTTGDAPTDAGGTRSNVALASRGATARASSVYPDDPHHRLEHINDGRYGNNYSWISRETRDAWVEIELAQPTPIDTVIWGRDREGAFADRVATRYRIEVLVEGIGWRVVARSDDRRPMVRTAQVYAGRFNPVPMATHRLERGNPMEPREVVAPGGVACVAAPFELRDPGSEPARRVALAEWIVAPENPLAARVIVNRIWQQHFGRGLVETPSDLGAMGARPSHPELLDSLATDLVERGWRLKALHRRILLSATYCMASTPRSDALEVDAQTRLLWRFPPRRLPAEAIRDSMLAVAGVLDLTLGGPGVSTFAPNDNYVRVFEPKSEFGAGDFRRAIYLTRVRMHADGTFGVFDMPDGGQPCPRRAASNTPLQALTLLHAPLVHEIARRFAERVERDCRAADHTDAASQIARAFELAFQREPTAVELDAARRLAESDGLAACCRALLASGEFSGLE